jgi:hypothetical protein
VPLEAPLEAPLEEPFSAAEGMVEVSVKLKSQMQARAPTISGAWLVYTNTTAVRGIHAGMAMTSPRCFHHN